MLTCIAKQPHGVQTPQCLNCYPLLKQNIYASMNTMNQNQFLTAFKLQKGKDALRRVCSVFSKTSTSSATKGFILVYHHLLKDLRLTAPQKVKMRWLLKTSPWRQNCKKLSKGQSYNTMTPIATGFTITHYNSGQPDRDVIRVWSFPQQFGLTQPFSSRSACCRSFVH